jgi:protein Mpv17
MGVMEGRKGAEIKQKYTDLYAPAILANWTVWPFVQVSPYLPFANVTC